MKYFGVNKRVIVERKDYVGQGTHIGTNSSVIDGTVIGEWSYIGAGAAVVKNIGSHVMAYGVPAREIRSLKE